MAPGTRSRWWLTIAGLLAIATALVAPAGGLRTAEAHPLGNFTINRYTRIELSETGIRLRYVVDMAEIPAFQERGAIDVDSNGTIDDRERASYVAARQESLKKGVRLNVGGRAIDLRPEGGELTLPPGQGGLPTVRLVLDYAASLPDGWETARNEVTYRDTNYDERLGWREVVVRSSGGVRIAETSVPAQDVSDELRAYPEEGLSNPLNVSGAQFAFEPGTAAGAAAPTASQASRTASPRADDRFTSLVSADELTLTFVLGALVVAFGLGALHALGPGHGKTVVAAYLVGERGTARHAVLLGFMVTATHTSSVFALALITLYASQFIVPELLYPWLSVASGLLVLVLGGYLLLSRVRAARSRGRIHGRHRHDDAHDHVSHAHEHGDDHAHADEHGHAHVLPGADGSPVTLRSLVALGISGGLVPCPSALVVLLGAISVHRIGLGLLLITSFSLGLAVVLTVIGLAMVWVGRAMTASGRRFERGRVLMSVARALPVASALAITVVGLVMTARAVDGVGL